MDLQARTLGLHIVALVGALMAPCFAAAQTVGTNVNMVSGTQWPGGDPFLQRQNEPSMAVSSRNPFHLLAGANDYRSVDLALTTNGETGDAWLGLFKSLDGGATWRSILLPGCPYNTPICAGAPAVRNAGYQAAADPTVRAGTNGMFYYAGLVFNRGFNPSSAIVVSRLIDLNNKENADPSDILNGDAIQYIGTSIVASGSSSQFLDKPTMAVDIPRSDDTCNFTVNQPGNGLVRQSFAAGNVYVAYTSFSEAPNTDPETVTTPQKSKIYFVRSENCGATWSRPVAISGSGVVNQGAVITISPVKGTVYVAWRQFHYQSGTISQPDAIVGTMSFDGGETFAAPVRVSTFTPFDEGTTNTSFRTNAYPTAAFDATGRTYVAYSARNTVPSGDARVVLTSSVGGSAWTPPVPVDNPPIDPLSNPFGRGHQIMPALTFAAGKLSLLYYDLRLDHTFGLFSPLLSQGQPTGLYGEFPELAGELGLTPPLTGAVFNQFIDDSTITMRRHTFDLRVAQALPGKVPVFAPSILVSQYAYGCCAANQIDIEQLEFNVPNLPIFRSGTAPFMGDYVDIAASPSFLPPHGGGSDSDAGGDGDGDNDDWKFNIGASTPTFFHATWTDNRDVQAPADGDWTHYTPPNSPSVGSTSIFQPGTSVPACRVGFTGSRNQNIYTAPISNGLVFGAPGNAKPLGTTVFNGVTVPFQRAFSLVAQNTTNVIKSFRMTIANQPPGGNASFLQFAQLTTLDLSIPPLSSAARPVFVTSTSPTASVTVNITEITAPQGTLVPGGLTSFTILNPDPTNPGITNPTVTTPGITNPGITNFEVTNPAITTPGITNPGITNPGITNPGITNPGITNSTFQSVTVVNPGITNPGITNPGITNASIANPGITNPGITNLDPANTSVSDTQWTVSNTGNTEGSFAINLASSSPVPLGNVLQLIISKLYQTPAAPSGQDCSLKIETHNVVVTNIVNPVLLNPTNPGITNPGITNPGITNATVALAPGETANIIIRVVNTDTHTFPTFNPAASVAPVVVSQAVPTQTVLSSGGGPPPPPPITVPPLQITTTSLPDAVTGSVYAATVQTIGGNPTTHTFSLTAGALPPGLTLDPATGAITGIVAASGVATFSFGVQVQDVGSPSFPQHTATQSLSIRVGSRMVFSPLTLPSATQGASYSQNVTVTGGIGTIVQTVVGGNLPPGLTLSPLSGLISGIPTASGPFSFTVQAADSAVPPQIVSQGYTINVVANVQVLANVAFVTQPGDSVGGQVLGGSPVIVQVTDNTGATIPNAPVTMSFSGTPPCSAATLTGTLSQTTNAQGQATFNNLSIDRGQLGYTFRAAVGNASAVSNPFTVNGFCATKGPLDTKRQDHSSTTLLDGSVLVAGGGSRNAGVSSPGLPFNSAVLYDPAAGTFTATGNMNVPRWGHTATRLPDGRVLITGGVNSPSTAAATVTDTAEIYNPATRTFTLTNGPMNSVRFLHSATLLADGRVLIAGGGTTVNAACILCFANTVTDTAEVFDPATGLFSPTSNTLASARQLFTSTLLPNGQVLIAGGFTLGNSLSSSEIFDPVSNAFHSTANMTAARVLHVAALLSDGKILIAGPDQTAELYDPATGTFSAAASLVTATGALSAAVLANGTVILPGGLVNGGGPSDVGITAAQVYDPSTGTFSLTGPLISGEGLYGLASLPDGTMLVTGGENGDQTVLDAEVYYSTAPLAPMQITTTALFPAATGKSFTQILLQQGAVGNLTWTVTGSLPAGMSFTNQGILIGTPTVAGSFPLTFTLTDSSTPAKTATTNLTLTVTNSQLVFTSNTVPTAAVGRPYAQALPVAGGMQPYNGTVTSGTLPPGMAVVGNMLLGTPTGSGNFTFTVSVTDSSSPTQTATQTLSMSVNTLVITTAALPNGIVNVPYNTAINTAGGAFPFSFSSATAGFPPGLLIQQPFAGSSNATLSGMPTQAGTFTFSESVTDSSNPAQTATQNYVVTIAPAGSAVPANVFFVTAPQNSVGGQILRGGPQVVQVTDANNTPIPNTTVTMSLTGVFGTSISCSVATLGGGLAAVTDAKGQATFSNLSVDRGASNYALLASTGSASGSSGPFAVQGFCAGGNFSTQREGHSQDLLVTAQTTAKFPLSPRAAYIFTNTNPGPNLPPDVPDAPLIIPLASFGIKPGDVISGVPFGDMSVCSPGSSCSAEFFTPFVCAVFSSSNALLLPGAAINRVPGAIAPDSSTATAFPCGTGNTAFGNLPTDISQDFVLAGERVTVPAGAKYLFVGVSDIFYSDNSDANGDFGVEFTLNAADPVTGKVTSVNGKVLIAGGFDKINNGNVLNTAELYDPALGFTQLTGNLTDPNGRANHASVVLRDGRVLLIGGISNINVLASAELYDPKTGTFTATGNNMADVRAIPEAVLLPDGRVLVTGGIQDSAALNTAEIFDPSKNNGVGAFTPTGNMNQSRARHTMTLLPNGKVLVTGGRDAQLNFAGLASAELFDPLANNGVGAFIPLGNMSSPRFAHAATLLSNGTVLVTGGFTGPNGSSIATAETFDPATNAFTPTGNMLTSRARHRATLLPDGTVLEAGGIDATNGISAAAPAELYNPATRTFSATGSMITGREFPEATLLLPNGNVLLSGGDNGVDVLSSTEVYFNTIAQAPIVITTTAVPNGIISRPYVQLLLSQNKSAPIFWSLTAGTLPPGITVTTDGILSGTPTTVGSFTFTVQVTDGIGTASATFTISVSLSTLAFTSNTMPTAGVGRAYSQNLPVTGGTLPYTASVTSGSLPPGLALSSTGVLSGTPTSAGSFTYTVTVTDSSTPVQTATQTLTMAVDTLFITTIALPSGIVGVPYNAAISTSGGTLPLTFSAANASFPTGLTIQQPAANSPTGALAGRPTQAEHYTFTETVSDSSSPIQTATQYYTMDIFPAGSTAAPAHVTFRRQPQNSVGGQILAGTPIVVNVTDANNAPIQGASVAISFNGPPPCPTAVLTGTLTGVTGGNGNVAFTDLSIDRGQLGYTLLASAGSASAVSNPFTVNGFCATGNLSSPRRFPTSTLLPNGKVLVIGGDPDTATNGATSSELFDPASGTFTSSGNMAIARAAHKATLLSSGKVLVTGGRGSGNAGVTAELYDPTSGLFALAGNMSTSRQDHTSTLLADGRVLIAGGFSGLLGSTAVYSNGTEAYDPTAGTFSPGGNLNVGRAFHTATLLPNGKVLIAGGSNSSGPLASAEIYDPISGTSTTVGNMSTPRNLHTATLLPNGKVLLAGGQTSTAGLASAELFDPAAGTFTPTGNMLSASVDSRAVLLPDGKVLIASGFTFPSTISEVYDPAAGSFSQTGDLVQGRRGNGATLLANGQVLVSAGQAPGPPTNPILNSAEIYYSTAPLVPLQITTLSSLAPATLGKPYTQILLEQGGVGSLTWTLTGGSLPTGVTLSTNGILLGTPTVAGNFVFTTQLVDSSVPAKTTSAAFSLTVNGQTLVFAAQTLPTAINGAGYGASLVASGGTPPYNFAVTSGAIPAGINLASNGTFSGTSTAVGSSTLTVTVTDSSTPVQTASQTFTFQAANPLAITTTTLPGGMVGVPYMPTISSTGGVTPVGFGVTSGTLPTGLTLFSSGPQSATLSGALTTAGTFTFTITASDASTPSQSASQTYTVTIAPAVAPVANITFTTPPQTSVEGQVLANSPVQVQVTDSTSTPLPNVTVNIGFGGTPPCAVATLGGTLTQTTDATGTATFSNLVIDRGQFNYVLAATAGNLTVPSNSFNVEGFCDTGSLAVARVNAAAITLPNGKVLVAGGSDRSNNVFSSAELYDPATHTFTTIGSMNVARSSLTVTQLPNGKVLVAGGNSASAELFDPSANSFALLASPMTTARTNHAAVALSNGMVLITGGGGTAATAASAEIFDPATNTFTATTGAMNSARSSHHSDLLPNGKVLISGGFDFSLNPLASAELYDPVTDTFTLTGSMATARGQHAAALLFNGKVLVAGGKIGIATGATPTATAEIYDPSSALFSATGSMTQARARVTAIVLNDGTVFMGNGITPTGPVNDEIYDPTAATFRATANMTVQQGILALALIPDGTVLLAGGTNAAAAVPNAEIFYPASFVPISITTVLPTALLNVLYTQQLQEKGGVGALTWTVSAGTLPTNLTLSSSGYLFGTPTVTGVSQFTVQVTDSSTPPRSSSTNFIVAVVPPLTVLASLPTANPGVAYNQSILVSGAAPPFTFAQTAGALPTGLALASDGTVSGITTAVGTFTFTVQVTDSSTPPVSVTQAVSLTVAPPLAIVTTTLPNGQVGTAYNASITTSGGSGTIVFAVSSGTLPTGLTLSPQGALSGTPSAATTFTFTVAAADSSAQPQVAQQTYTVTIAPLVITSLAVQPSSPSILVGGVQQFVAVGTLPSGSTQNLTTSVTWSSSNTATATISNASGSQGFATGLSVGTVTITADLNGAVGSAVLSVVSSSTATQFAYVANRTDGTVSADALNSANGALAAISESPFAAGITAPNGLAVDPTARFLYVSTFGGPSISGLAINGATGALTSIPGSPFAQGSSPIFLAVDPTGRFVFTANLGSDNVSVFSIDQNTGALTPIAASPFAAGSQPHDVTIDPKGRFAYVANCGSGSGCTGTGSGSVTVYSIDPVTGALTAIPGSPFLAGLNPTAVTTDPTGTYLYVTNTGFGTVSAFAIDPNSGSLSAVPDSPFQVGTQPTSLSVDRAGKLLYVANGGSSNISAFTINPATGSLTPIIGSPFQAGSGSVPTSVAVDATNQFVYVSDAATHVVGFSINPANGALNGIGTFAAGNGAVFVTTVQTSGTQAMNLATDGPLLAINRSFNATVTLTQPVPTGSSVTVALAGNPSGLVSISPATQTIQPGQTTAVFTLTAGSVGGSVVLTATATGFNNATAPLTVTSNLISFDTIPVLAPGQSGSLPVSLSFAAPPGGLTISFTSANTSVATITPSVFVPAGLFIPAANPQVTGVSIGATQITATATGFAPDSATVTVTVTASVSPNPISVNATGAVTETLTISAPAPAGGITFSLASDNTAAATVPATATVPQGQLSVTFGVTGVAQGSANLTVTSPGIATITAPISVGPIPGITLNIPIVGNNLVTQASISLDAAPPPNAADLTLTLTSSDPTHFLLTANPAKVGSASITLPLTQGSFSVPPFYIEGQNFSGTTAITATLTASASGYTNGTATVSLYPTGLTFYFGTDTLNTTTFSPPTVLTVYLTTLNPGTLTYYLLSGNPLGPQAPGPISVAVTSSNTSVGSVTGSPASISVGAYYAQAISFVPATAGTTNLNLATPTGYFTPANIPVQTVATVTAPSINLSSPIIVGNNTIIQGSISLGAAPPSTPTNPSLTLTSSDPTHFLLTADPAKVGSASITLPLTPGSLSVPPFYIEGQNFSGTTAITATLTASSSGYANGTSTFTLYPTGLAFLGSGGTLNTTTFSSPSTLTVYLVLLTPGTLNLYTYGYPLGPQAPGAGPVSVTSSNTSVGTVTGSPASIPVGSYFTSAFSFVPATAGTTNLNLVTPTGYSTPANVPVQIATTVTAPSINLSSPIVGNNTIIQGSISLDAAPPSTPTNPSLTLTSSDPTHFLLTADPAKVGSASITLPLTPGSFSVPAFYIEGQNFSGTTAITATLTASAPGYTNGTSTLTLYPTGLGFLFSGGALNTTTFSSPSPLTVYLVLLTPGTLNFYTYGYPLGPQAPGAGPVSMTSSNTSVGTVTGSPTSIGVGAYYTQAISFVPATAGTTNLNLATPTGYFTPANVPVQIATTVTAPAINFNGGNQIIGNNTIIGTSINLGAAPPSNETLTLSSSDPTHFLLSADPTKVGTVSINLQLAGGSFNVPVFYIEGQNFSGVGAITATLKASAAGYSDGSATLSLYPTGLAFLGTGGTLNTTTFSSPSTLTVYLVLLTPGTLNLYTYGYPLGPQAPGAGPVSVTSSNTSVGTVTGSPASIGVGAYYTQAISFVPATAGTTNLNLATPTGYSTPANQPVQLVTTVTAPAITINVNSGSNIVGNNLLNNGSIGIGAAPPSNETMTITSGDPTHFLLSTDPAVVGKASITLQLTGGSFSVPAFYIEGQNFSGAGAITATLTASAAGYSDGSATLSLYPTGLAFLSGGTLNTTTTAGPTPLTAYLVLLSPGTLNLYTYGYPLGPQAPAAVPVAVISTNTGVGTVTGSPASIGLGAYYTQAISFVPATAGTTSLDLATPTGYSTPTNVPVQIAATVQ